MMKSPYDFAIELKNNLQIRESMNDLEPSSATDLSNLDKIEEEIFTKSNRLDQVKTQVELFRKDYQIYNFRYGLGESHSDLLETKKLRSDSWENLANAEEERDDLYKRISELRTRRDELSHQVGHIKRQRKAVTDFFRIVEYRTTLYAIVTLEIKFETITFQLLTEDQRTKAWGLGLDTYAVESPIGQACINKMAGEEISYTAPNGLNLQGRIVEFSLPSLQQMESLISTLDAKHQYHSKEEVNPFHLHDMYGTNNSRIRKGG